MMRKTQVLSDVHVNLPLPLHYSDFAIVRGKYEFYHYNVDGFDDRVCSLINTSYSLDNVYCTVSDLPHTQLSTCVGVPPYY